MNALAPRVLRGLDLAPHAFAALDGPPPTPREPPAFVSLRDVVLGALPEVPVEPEPDPLAPVVDAAFQSGRQAGRADRDAEVAGLRAEVERLAAALDASTQTAAEQAALVESATDRLATHWSEAVRALELDLAALAVETAEAVLTAPLSDDQRAAAERALAAAVDALAGGATVTVALHPVDLLHLQESGLSDAVQGAHPDLRWEPDSALAEGDWSVSTDDAAVRRVRTEMMGALRERLGLPTPA